MNCELSDCSHIWLYHTEEGNKDALKRYASPFCTIEFEPRVSMQFGYSLHIGSISVYVFHRYFLSVACVSYGRETKLRNVPDSLADETPLHRLAVHGLKVDFAEGAHASLRSQRSLWSLNPNDILGNFGIPTNLMLSYRKGAWTKHNRDVVFGLFDTFINAVNLRRNMTNEALKPFKMEQANKSGRKVSRLSSISRIHRVEATVG